MTFSSGGFRVVAGTPTTYRSSPHVVRTFCPVCGTPLTYARDDRPDEIDVTTCSLDDPEAHPPGDQSWTGDRLGWFDGIPSLPGFTRDRRSS